MPFSARFPSLPEPETPDGSHRLWLCRGTSVGGLFGGTDRTLMWTMLNPSKAGIGVNDPTSVRITRFSRDGGYDWLLGGNLFTRRATDPRDLDFAGSVNVPEADDVLVSLASLSDAIVLAWGAAAGANSRAVRERAAHVRRLLAATRKPLLCLGYTQAGAPRHPLFVPAATALRPIPEVVK